MQKDKIIYAHTNSTSIIFRTLGLSFGHNLSWQSAKLMIHEYIFSHSESLDAHANNV